MFGQTSSYEKLNIFTHTVDKTVQKMMYDYGNLTGRPSQRASTLLKGSDYAKCLHLDVFH